MNLVIDAGGTNLRAQIWHSDNFIAAVEAKSRSIGLYAWIETLLCQYRQIKTIGISFAGQVEDGRIISAPNILIDEHHIKEKVESKYGVRLKIENDLDCAVLAEAKALEVQNICALYVGTGLGLGAMESGRVIKGFKNVATEIGHIPYKKTSLRCGCGRDNCLELYASGSGIAKQVKHKGRSCGTTLEELRDAGENEIATMFEEALLVASGTTLTLFNPQVLVLGGGIIEANPYLEKFIIKNIKDYALSNSLDGVTICKSRLTNASLAGALLLKDYHG
ncbi:MAG: ROK family protein [Sulfurovum sp.]|nr:ROK family protein [Sulfurovum sp.]